MTWPCLTPFSPLFPLGTKLWETNCFNARQGVLKIAQLLAVRWSDWLGGTLISTFFICFPIR